MLEKKIDWLTLNQDWFDRELSIQIRNALGPASRTGMAYRWGLSAESGIASNDLAMALSSRACGWPVTDSLHSDDLIIAIHQWLIKISDRLPMSRVDAALTVMLAAALPALHQEVGEVEFVSLCNRLVSIHADVMQHSDVSDPVYLLLGAELGWMLHLLTGGDLVGKSRESSFRQAAEQAFCNWCENESDAVPRAIQGGKGARLVLASLIRLQKLGLVRGLGAVQQSLWSDIGKQISQWVIGLSGQRGSTGFSVADSSMVKDDIESDGLLDQAVNFDKECFANARDAVVGKAPKQPPLAWEVSLPETMMHDPKAKLAVMMAGWNVRSGRMHVDYHDSSVALQLYNGKHLMLSGSIDVDLHLNGQQVHSTTAWEEVCEYSDDDVHYLEVEQDWAENLVLQRQFLLMREDRCVLFADAVLPKAVGQEVGEIRYRCRVPLSEKTAISEDDKIREAVLTTAKRKSLCIPLESPEWRMGTTSCELSFSGDHHLILESKGSHRLYTPLWFDFARRRLARKRTWRQLTVADQLRLVKRSEAVGYRIQAGSEQWMIYRSLVAGDRTRTVLGKHLIADFYCARFDSGDGSYEELITVDDHEN